MSEVSLNVLIVDDDPHQRALLERLCLENGHKASCVSDGRAALAALGAARYDLMFLDLIMPELDGIGVLRAMREQTGRAMPRVVVVSSQADEAAIEETVSLGASVYLTKPVPNSTIQKVLGQMVLRATLSGVR